MLERLLSYGKELRPMVRDTVHYVNTAVQEGKRVVVEGANAAMLDIDFGKGSTHACITYYKSSPMGHCKKISCDRKDTPNKYSILWHAWGGTTSKL